MNVRRLQSGAVIRGLALPSGAGRGYKQGQVFRAHDLIVYSDEEQIVDQGGRDEKTIGRILVEEIDGPAADGDFTRERGFLARYDPQGSRHPGLGIPLDSESTFFNEDQELPDADR